MAKDPTTYAKRQPPPDQAPMAAFQAPAAVRSRLAMAAFPKRQPPSDPAPMAAFPKRQPPDDDTTTSAMKGYRKGGLVKKAAATNRYAKKRK